MGDDCGCFYGDFGDIKGWLLMKYKANYMVDAVQWLKYIADEPQTWPKWLIEAALLFPGDHGRFWRDEFDNWFLGADATVQVFVGDYIIRDIYGELRKLNPGQFRDRYEKVVEDEV